uniref:Uncharacterized protein n=1 Tax=Lotharella globosa TaxID=91324 RepID=A0A7S3YNM4_9EUKA
MSKLTGREIFERDLKLGIDEAEAANDQGEPEVFFFNENVAHFSRCSLVSLAITAELMLKRHIRSNNDLKMSGGEAEEHTHTCRSHAINHHPVFSSNSSQFHSSPSSSINYIIVALFVSFMTTMS